MASHPGFFQGHGENAVYAVPPNQPSSNVPGVREIPFPFGVKNKAELLEKIPTLAKVENDYQQQKEKERQIENSLISQRQKQIGHMSDDVPPLEVRRVVSPEEEIFNRQKQIGHMSDDVPPLEFQPTEGGNNGINPFYIVAGGIPVALAGAYAAKRYFDSKKNK